MIPGIEQDRPIVIHKSLSVEPLGNGPTVIAGSLFRNGRAHP